MKMIFGDEQYYYFFSLIGGPIKASIANERYSLSIRAVFFGMSAMDVRYRLRVDI